MVVGRSRGLCRRRIIRTRTAGAQSDVPPLTRERVTSPYLRSKVVVDTEERRRSGENVCTFHLRVVRTASCFHVYLKWVIFKIKIFYLNNTFTVPTPRSKRHFYFNNHLT